MTETKRSFFLSDAAYNYLKTVVQLLIPAFASFYFGLAGIWNLPNADQVVGTSALLATFLGVILRLSSRAYAREEALINPYDGQWVVANRSDGVMTYVLEFNGDPGDIPFKDSVSFKVVTKNDA